MEIWIEVVVGAAGDMAMADGGSPVEGGLPLPPMPHNQPHKTFTTGGRLAQIFGEVESCEDVNIAASSQ